MRRKKAPITPTASAEEATKPELLIDPNTGRAIESCTDDFDTNLRARKLDKPCEECNK